MGNLEKVFSYQEKTVRTITRNGEPWFVVKDVCDILEIQNSRDTLTRLDEDEKDVDSIYTLGGNQEMQVVSESGLYNLIIGSKKTEAKAFKRWVTHEVLPSIRKTGMYLSNDLLQSPEFLFQVVCKYKEEREISDQLRLENKVKDEKIEEMQPLVDFAESLLKSDTLLYVEEFAKLIYGDGSKMGRNKMFAWLRRNGYLTSSNRPMQQYMDYFAVIETYVSIPTFNGYSTVTKITPLGQYHLYNKLIKEGLALTGIK